MALASTLLPAIAPELRAVKAVRPGRPVSIDRGDADDLALRVALEVEDLLVDDRSVGVIAPGSHVQGVRAALTDVGIQVGDVDRDALERQVTLLTPAAAKGLEFDHVVVVEPAQIVREGRRGLTELYVALTRATQRLSLVLADVLPAPLPGGVELDKPAAPHAVPDGDLEHTVAPDLPAVSPMILSGNFSEALVFAKLHHGRQPRRGTAVPYLSHLLAVCSLVLEDGGTEEEAVAALLHDAAEDAEGQATVGEIAARFGGSVAGIVALCTDPPDEGAGWRMKKRAHLEILESAPATVRRVALAEKLDNARAIVRGLREVGPEVWRKMGVNSDDLLWYFGELAEFFASAHPGSLAAELQERVSEMNRLAGLAGAEQTVVSSSAAHP
jgi:hypothetical protein